MDDAFAEKDRLKISLAAKGDEKSRLDACIAKNIRSVSRSRARKLILTGFVLLNGAEVLSPSATVSSGDIITVSLPPPENAEDPVKAQAIPLEIIFEDPCLIVVNKPAGMVTHPADTVMENTLVNALLGRTKRLSSVNGPMRRGIIHRLDKDTSGLLIIARTDEAHLNLANQLQSRAISRRYRALVMGNVEPETGEISAPIGRHAKNRVKMGIRFVNGREAITRFKVIEKFNAGDEIFTYLDISLQTGRTHQIRVHFSSIGHPVCADAKYGRKSPVITIGRQALHARSVGFAHPGTGKPMQFCADIPEDMKNQIEQLKALQGGD